jgi:hypothetical protein
MWQNKFESPLDLELYPSRYLLAYLLLIHALAGLALSSPLQLTMEVRGLLLLLVLSSLAWHIYRFHLSTKTVTQLRWRTDGSWDYQCGETRIDDLQLLPASYVTSGLMILHLKKPGTRRLCLVLLPDSLPAAVWHQLRIRLQFPRLV